MATSDARERDLESAGVRALSIECRPIMDCLQPSPNKGLAMYCGAIAAGASGCRAAAPKWDGEFCVLAIMGMPMASLQPCAGP